MKEEIEVANTDVEHETPGISPQQQNATAPASQQQDEVYLTKNNAVAGTDSQIKTIDDWLAANQIEDAEARKKRERREKSKKIISAISDGIQSLSNLYFTTQYAPNMYSHETMSNLSAVEKGIEKAKADRERLQNEHLQFALKRGELQNQRAKTLREVEAQHEAQKLAREKANREEEKHKWEAYLQPGKVREQEGKANKAEQEAITAQAIATAAPELQTAKIETERSRKAALDAAAANHRASASGLRPQFYAWDKSGKRYDFKTKDAAITFARQHGTLEEYGIQTKNLVDSERYGKTKTTQTKTGYYPAKPEPKQQKPQKQQKTAKSQFSIHTKK